MPRRRGPASVARFPPTSLASVCERRVKPVPGPNLGRCLARNARSCGTCERCPHREVAVAVGTVRASRSARAGKLAFRDWGGPRRRTSRGESSEAALAHGVRDRVEAGPCPVGPRFVRRRLLRDGWSGRQEAHPCDGVARRGGGGRRCITRHRGPPAAGQERPPSRASARAAGRGASSVRTRPRPCSGPCAPGPLRSPPAGGRSVRPPNRESWSGSRVARRRYQDKAPEKPRRCGRTGRTRPSPSPAARHCRNSPLPGTSRPELPFGNSRPCWMTSSRPAMLLVVLGCRHSSGAPQARVSDVRAPRTGG